MMPTRTVVTRVWIEPTCIGCDVCRQICPEVFEPRGLKCVVRAGGGDAALLQACSAAIMDAARDCPVEAIGYEAVGTESCDAPADLYVSRRGLMSSAGVGALALGGSVLLGGLATQRFLFPNVVDEPDPRIGVGKLSSYSAMPVGGVGEACKGQGVWIIRLADRIAALSTRCTHLGCLTHWVPGERTFRCPCHGSAFSQDGTNIEGPAPRALDRLKIWRVGDELFVDRGKPFQREKRQWDDPESFVSC